MGLLQPRKTSSKAITSPTARSTATGNPARSPTGQISKRRTSEHVRHALSPHPNAITYDAAASSTAASLEQIRAGSGQAGRGRPLQRPHERPVGAATAAYAESDADVAAAA